MIIHPQLLKLMHLCSLLYFFMFLSTTVQATDQKKYKPFILADELSSSLNDAKSRLKQQIKASPFELVAEYSPYEDAVIFIISSDELKTQAAKDTYGGYAAPQRISLTRVGNTIQVAYTNPVYMQYAYRMNKADLHPVLEKMKNAFGYKQDFGGLGLNQKKLQRYIYSFGLEAFDSFYQLPVYNTHQQAIDTLLKGFNDPSNGISEVYRINIPGKDQVIFGVSMNAVDSGIEELDNKKTMDIIDHKAVKRTAFLPYEIMVDEGNIIAMHARFRIAVNFSDLNMFGKHGFGKLFNTPAAYGKAFTLVSGGSLKSSNINLDPFTDQ